MRRGAALLALCLGGMACAQETPTVAHTATVAELFAASEVAGLAKTLPADQEVRFRVRAASGDSPSESRPRRAVESRLRRAVE